MVDGERYDRQKEITKRRIDEIGYYVIGNDRTL